LYTLYYKKVMGLRMGKGTIIMGKIRLYGDVKNIRIGDDCRIHDNTMLNAYMAYINIGNNVVLSPDVKLITPSLTKNKLYGDRTHIGKDINLHDQVWMATNATIIGGVTVGQGTIVSTGAVLTKSTGEYEIWAGVPAKKIGELQSKSEGVLVG